MSRLPDHWANCPYHYEVDLIRGIVGGFKYCLDRKYHAKKWALMELEQLAVKNRGFSNLKTRLIDSAIQKAIAFVREADTSGCQLSLLYHSSFKHLPEYYKGA